MVTKADCEPKARFNCPARQQEQRTEKGADCWTDRGPDRICSYCSSMRFDEFLSWCERACEPDSKVIIDCGDKPGKWNIVRVGIAGSWQGGVRMYSWHVPKDGSTEAERIGWNRTIGTAIERSVARVPAKK